MLSLDLEERPSPLRQTLIPTMPISALAGANPERAGAASSARLVALVMFVLLSYSFCTNGFSIVTDALYRSHGADPETLVLGRLIETESNGLASKTGFLAHHGYTDTYREFRTGQRPISMTGIYTGQVGLQGWVFSAIDMAMYKAGIAAPHRVVKLRVLSAIAFAGLLCLWFYLITMEFGAGAGLTAGLMVLYSPWLTVFADNLYWVPATWFAPVVLIWYWTVYRPDLFAAAPRTFYLFHGIVVVAKAMCGFEYISAVLGASSAAFVYGISKAGWDRRTLPRLVTFGAAAVAAIIVAFVIQLLLLAIDMGSLSGALADFVGRINYRSVGGGQVPPELTASLAMPLKEVLNTYLYDSLALNIPLLRAFTAAEAIAIWSVLLVMAMIYMVVHDRSLRRPLAPFLLVLISSAASVSWHVVAHGHSAVHTFFNHVLWFVPLLIILPAVAVGMFAEAFLSRQAFPFKAITAVLVFAMIWTVHWFGTIHAVAVAAGLAGRNIVVGERMTLRLYDNAIDGDFSCDGVNLAHPFFLRLHANAATGDARTPSGGSVQKFAFRNKATSTELNELRYGKCSFRVETAISFASLTIGQFSEDSGSAVDWQEDFQRR